jgi:hypothetical protein
MDWIWPFGRNKTIAGEALLTQGEGLKQRQLFQRPVVVAALERSRPQNMSLRKKAWVLNLTQLPESPELDSNRGPKPLRQKKGGWYWPF